MKKSTRKMQSPKLQIADKCWAALGSQPLLQANPAAALPLLSMIGQAQLSIEDLLGQLSRQFVEQLLTMSAESVAGPKHPRRQTGEVRWCRPPDEPGARDLHIASVSSTDASVRFPNR